MGLSAFDGQTGWSTTFDVNNGTGIGTQNLLVANKPQRRVDLWVATSSDTIDHLMTIWMNDVDGLSVIGQVNIPAGTGWGGVPALDVLDKLGLPFAGGIILPNGTYIRFAMAVAVVGAFHVAHYMQGRYL